MFCQRQECLHMAGVLGQADLSDPGAGIVWIMHPNPPIKACSYLWKAQGQQQRPPGHCLSASQLLK